MFCFVFFILFSIFCYLFTHYGSEETMYWTAPILWWYETSSCICRVCIGLCFQLISKPPDDIHRVNSQSDQSQRREPGYQILCNLSKIQCQKVTATMHWCALYTFNYMHYLNSNCWKYHQIIMKNNRKKNLAQD